MVGHPTGLVAFVVCVCLGAWLGGAVGVIAGTVGILGLAAAAARWPAVHRLIDRHQDARMKKERALERDRRLQRAGPLRRAEFAELQGMVGEIEGSSPGQAERFELQELLDYYIRLALSHQLLVEGVQRADRAPLWEAGTVRPRADGVSTSRQRHEILTRRIEHRDRCRARAARLAEELDAVAEFVHLVSEVTSCPLLDEGAERELERRLWELEAQESAMRQLSAA